MEEKNLVKESNGIFSKIKKFFRNLFKKNKQDEAVVSNEIIETNNANSMLDKYKIQTSEEELRILKLKRQLDNGEITEDDIIEKDMDALIELYQEETKQVEEDTLVRKNRIRNMLAELKSA
jgi:hypothetical protein